MKVPHFVEVNMQYKEKVELFCEGALAALLWTEAPVGSCVERKSEERFREFCASFFWRFEDQWDALKAFDQDFGRYERSREGISRRPNR